MKNKRLLFDHFAFWSLWYKQFAIGNFFLKKSSLYLLLCCLGGVEITNVESLQFDLDIIEAATNKFSEDNKIGEGGFGAVYKVNIKLILKVNESCMHTKDCLILVQIYF